jgi:hypothetical protein
LIEEEEEARIHADSADQQLRQCLTAADQSPGFYDHHTGAVASYCGLRSMFAT